MWRLSALLFLPLVWSRTELRHSRQLLQSGEVDISRSYAYGPGLKAASIYGSTSFFIQAIDADGNAVTEGGISWFATGTHNASSAWFAVTFTDNNDGTYSATYTVGLEGFWVLQIRDRNTKQALPGSPFMVTAYGITEAPSIGPTYVRTQEPTRSPEQPTSAPSFNRGPGAIYGPNCVASGTGLQTQTAGVSSQLMIVSYDESRNLLIEGGATITTNLPANHHIRDAGDGTYVVTFTATTAGTLVYSVRVNALEILGSPFSVRVLAGSLSPEHATASGKELAGGIVGLEYTFFVITRDSYGNQVASGGASVRVEMVNERGEEAAVVVLDEGDGSFKVTYQAITPGTYTTSVKVNGVEISESPFATVVRYPGDSIELTRWALVAGSALLSFLVLTALFVCCCRCRRAAPERSMERLPILRPPPRPRPPRPAPVRAPAPTPAPPAPTPAPPAPAPVRKPAPPAAPTVVVNMGALPHPGLAVRGLGALGALTNNQEEQRRLLSEASGRAPPRRQANWEDTEDQPQPAGARASRHKAYVEVEDEPVQRSRARDTYDAPAKNTKSPRASSKDRRRDFEDEPPALTFL